ncbi:DUF31 family putative serine protease [Malacoplasma iowae]|uniref:DUF31 family protein n=2 Tax=Malacoplasma iowae TaxID=2116 RepID=A0A6P1LC08_MALIO|nr:hypothetical protein [Malacoplasma iowae]VEU62572.1 Uncharacterised protein [Mycoplasmopsis fermentans]EGZ31387.1 hypothetical protein GUU_02062 [Malacoplasma iowae 695]KFB07539.1 putative peptidase, DUF31 superfamily [Malacoplasma iowae DK-CPA]QHG89717.1 DUF31 family protein [Malacoplasma iowae 695]WPL35490.1 hypothetical protein QX180_04125 [Malacoplasma iowae]
MKFNILCKICSVPLLFGSTFVFTSCFYGNYVIENYSSFDSPEIFDYKKNSEHLKYISERSFSLRFKTRSSNGESFVNGTSWIISKDKRANHVYYLATNLHVAAIVNNSGKSFKRALFDKNNNTIKVSNDKEATLVGMDVGIIWDRNLTPGTSLATQTQDTKLKYIENINNTYYNSNFNVSPALIPNQDFSVVYSANTTFKSFDVLDPTKTRYDSSYVLNPTSDFAVLRVDFSKFYNQPYNYKYSSLLANMLSNYNYSPTKIADTVVEGEKLYIGGFPADTHQDNGSYIPRWSGIEIDSGWKIKEGHKNYYPLSNLPHHGYKNYRPSDLPEINFIGVGKDDINNPDKNEFNENIYYSQKNVAVQGCVKNINLLGGSSGSMVINSKNEVVGIYWGGYQTIYNFNGTFDFINVNQNVLDIIKKNNNGITINQWEYKYNLYEEFKKSVGII